MSQVILEKLTKRFGDVVAVDGIDLHINDRERIVLVGPSGRGKSTTLRMIAGLEEITDGQVRIGDRVVNDVPPKDRNIAMVFQNYALYPHMNVYKNMAFGLKMRRVAKAEVDRRVRRAADILGIEPLLRRKPAELSGGQRQRVAVGRAIVRDPDVFLLDEPLSNLDAKLRVTTRAELVKLHQKLETTMIYVTHDQLEAMTIGHRIVVMQHGQIQQVDTPLAVYDRPANRFVAEFVGSPPMNLLEAAVQTKNDRMMLKLGTIDLSISDQHETALAARTGTSVNLGIRAEDIVLNPPQTAPPGCGRFQATVQGIQLLGADAIVEVARDRTVFLARADPRESFPAGQHVNVAFNMSRAHLFDPDSGDAIR